MYFPFQQKNTSSCLQRFVFLPLKRLQKLLFGYASHIPVLYLYTRVEKRVRGLLFAWL